MGKSTTMDSCKERGGQVLAGRIHDGVHEWKTEMDPMQPHRRGMDEEMFLRRNVDAAWLRQNEMWEDMDTGEETI